MIIVDKKVKISIITILIIVSGFMAYEIASGDLLSYAFDEIGYNYTGFVSIPNDTTNGGSLGGTLQYSRKWSNIHIQRYNEGS